MAAASSRIIQPPNVQLPAQLAREGAATLAGYQAAVAATDKLPAEELTMPVLGLFGEVGSLLAVLKKKSRDAAAYAAYDAALTEELGDVLWYLTCIAHRVGLDLGTMFRTLDLQHGRLAGSQLGAEMFSDLQRETLPHRGGEPLTPAIQLAKHAGELVGELPEGLAKDRDRLASKLGAILWALLNLAGAADIDIEAAARRNLEKTFSRWPLQFAYPELPDGEMPTNEQLPRTFDMLVEEHQVGGKTYVLQKCNGIIVGDRLTDNKAEQDDYRFHDVFHIAYAVHLGWSPTLRALLHLKRKSAPMIDESEDGARAVLTEEGIATFIFGRAIERQLFAGLAQLDLDLLKMVQSFVRGFEAERCALWQWERAILDGFEVFRQLKRHRRGLVRADLLKHTLTFEPTARKATALEPELD